LYFAVEIVINWTQIACPMLNPALDQSPQSTFHLRSRQIESEHSR
jgi:hypothetical protein